MDVNSNHAIYFSPTTRVYIDISRPEVQTFESTGNGFISSALWTRGVLGASSLAASLSVTSCLNPNSNLHTESRDGFLRDPASHWILWPVTRSTARGWRAHTRASGNLLPDGDRVTNIHLCGCLQGSKIPLDTLGLAAGVRSTKKRQETSGKENKKGFPGKKCTCQSWDGIMRLDGPDILMGVGRHVTMHIHSTILSRMFDTPLYSGSGKARHDAHSQHYTLEHIDPNRWAFNHLLPQALP